ncbi:uncharacterized protein LOC135582740 isoform X1 [Musa acuminata AAA Group]|uniref:Xaa-Pro dipeptidase n=1 Tax=Musa acuminata subsp. malaccensis TaxID=214687 RepID=A0A804JTU5_MUSAM|nr:PREDICTED: xaa-Pro dipeptidase isoform X1 [Musa acuminata subsp. malaccensis]XP_009408876.1 PREDICTED: xaa-Pro dipeptidase isoform X1 [Musa acuminata subsp. malaccensis]CAG1856063.1 unnamed protein product [Musa acuminata subsp. malaccensis]
MAASTLSPPEVPMELHAHNRDKLVRALRDHLAASSRPTRGFVLLQGGEEQTRYCTDHAELFRQESYFAYLFGVREPGFFGAIDVASGKSFLFVPRLPADYAVWLGEIKPLSFFKERYMVDLVFYVDELVLVLHDHSNEPGKPLLFLLYGLNTDSNNFSKPAAIEDMNKFDTDLSTLHPILTECRVIKSKMELDLIQYANDVSSEAHIEVMRRIRSGMKEYQLESIFLHHIYMYGGCRHCSYTCICATGENSAVLHYGHAAAPNDRILEEGDMALFDMGAEYHFYGSDITCSFPVNGKFTKDQIVIYNAVLAAHNAVLQSMRPGVCWIDMHKLAEKTILESLKNEGIVIGDIDKMMERRLGAVFMPHGLGHFLGIDTHDPGGYAQGLERPKEPGLKALRTIRELKESMVITVEPGCYFIDAMLVPAMEDAVTSKFLNKKEIEKYKKFGGVRIESDVVVTADGCKNLTNCPRETWEIEAVMAGAPWPLDHARFKSQNGSSGA